MEIACVFNRREKHEQETNHKFSSSWRFKYRNGCSTSSSNVKFNFVVFLFSKNLNFGFSRFETALIKTVKFRENPSPDELVKQLNLVSQKFTQICSSVRNLTIRLER